MYNNIIDYYIPCSWNINLFQNFEKYFNFKIQTLEEKNLITICTVNNISWNGIHYLINKYLHYKNDSLSDILNDKYCPTTDPKHHIFSNFISGFRFVYKFVFNYLRNLV